jgi:hypothetical protein
VALNVKESSCSDGPGRKNEGLRGDEVRDPRWEMERD